MATNTQTAGLPPIVLSRETQVLAGLIFIGVEKPKTLEEEVAKVKKYYSDWLTKQGLTFSQQAEAKGNLAEKLNKLF